MKSVYFKKKQCFRDGNVKTARGNTVSLCCDRSVKLRVQKVKDDCNSSGIGNARIRNESRQRLILLAKSCRSHQRAKPRNPNPNRTRSLKPSHHPRNIHRCGNNHVLQPRLHQTPIPSPPQTKRPNTLRNTTLNPSPFLINRIPTRLRQPSSGSLKFLVLRLGSE